MDESERLQRYKRDGDDRDDRLFAERISALLNHPKIDHYCMIDAYYYDFSVIPREVQQKLNLWRDAYLIFGITTEGEMISKWVDRWDLDSVDPIVDGKVIVQPRENKPIPKINQYYDPKLLSTPVPNIISESFGFK